jgi:hypothetical protein
MGTEFGRRRPAATTQAAERPRAATTSEAAAEQSAGFDVLSWLFGRPGAIVAGLVVICVLASFYVSGMRGMGRALDESWGKPIVLESEPPNFQELTRRPCDVRSHSTEFRKLQKELGC